MRILQIHNQYQQPGGEDRVVELEESMLREHGHEVLRFGATNDSIRGLLPKMKVAWQAPHASSARAACLSAIADADPDVAHVHNLFPLLTPSVLEACAHRRLPVVMTLHNYRLLCVGAFFMRDGTICTECLDSSPYRGALHRCYRGSLLGSVASARVVSIHRRRETWQRGVHRFLALTEFSRNLFIEAGFPENRMRIKPNFCQDPRLGDSPTRQGALFVGRLSREKGISTLLSAWSQVRRDLRIAGSGPDQDRRPSVADVSWLGHLSEAEVRHEMRTAEFLVLPSECLESFGVVIIEAFAQGLPVLTSRLGSLAEIVTHGVTGLHFEPGNADDLAAQARWLFGHPAECRRMGANARAEYDRLYTPERNYELLMTIYREAIEEGGRSRAAL